jgi:hypothetical protein
MFRPCNGFPAIVHIRRRIEGQKRAPSGVAQAVL